MAPISDIADTMSFGLVGKLRKITHVSAAENNVQKIDDTKASSICNKFPKNANSVSNSNSSNTNYTSKPSTKSPTLNNKCLANKLEQENTITAAYNFNGAIINTCAEQQESENVVPRLNSHSNRSSRSNSSSPLNSSVNLNRSKSLQNENFLHRKSSTTSSLDSNHKQKRCYNLVSPLFKKKNTENHHNNSNFTQKNYTDSIPSTTSSKTLISTNTIPGQSFHNHQFHSYKNKANHMLLPSRHSVIDENDSIDNSSVISENYKFNVVIDHSIMPGIPTSVNDNTGNRTVTHTKK